jgi:hypothetical protein
MALSRLLRGFVRPALAGSLALFTGMIGCLNRPLEPNEPRITSVVQERLPQSRINKIDLLLVIDNSASMGDKQAILALAVPDLVRGLVNPLCIDDAGVAAPTQPALPTDPCPGKSFRDFNPVTDIHIGLLSSSLGSRGASSCQTSVAVSNDDHGHLLARSDASVGSTLAGQDIPTYAKQGFLAWDPEQKLDPKGIAAIGDINGTPGIVPTLAEMVKGVGQIGCGYESQLESWYRFLVDPEPYKSITIENKRSVLQGIDDELLAERKNFLRSDSLVAIVLLTDENDCSLTDAGIAFNAANGARLPRARHECQIDPNDDCCRSCAANQGTCPPDPTCATALTEDEDPVNLRCFDQKRRFGIDFLYKLDRYTNALTKDQVPNRAGDLVDNPLFPRPNVETGDIAPRTAGGGLVFLAGIVGVPWQDIARRNAQGQPDLIGGLDENKNAVGGFKSARELAAVDEVTKTSTWAQILGDAASGALPTDPLMRESREPRAGVVPSTSQSLAPPDASSPEANAVNGHEWLTSKSSAGDLQYACIFPLLTPNTNCAGGDCDCNTDGKNPLCQDDAGNYTDTQFRAKAYPGARELGVLEQIGDQGIVASVCPAQLKNPGAEQRDFGYRPATGAIIDRLKKRLSGECLHRSLTPDPDGQVECLILEARTVAEDEACNCGAPAVKGRQDVQTSHEQAKTLALHDPAARAAGWNCFCEIKQLSGDELHACQFDGSHEPKTASGGDADGWCYIDASSSPPAGDAALVATCDPTERRKLRFIGEGEPLDKTTLFITCSGQ